MTALDFPSGCMAFAPPPRCLLPQRVPPGSQWMGPQGLVTVLRASCSTVHSTHGATPRRRFLATHYRIW